MIRRSLLVVLCTLGPASPAGAQGYTAAQLDCARFRETVRSRIETETAGRVHRAVAERDGSWRFRARDSAGGVALEGWYDSLALRHGSGDTLAAPDTDGLIGGRYRGLLRGTGEYRRLAVPFVPDEVAEAADASAALDELLPRIPPDPLVPGERWSDGAGLEIERLPDSSGGGLTSERYRVRRRTVATEAVPLGDTIPVPLRQTTEEEGLVVWERTRGLVRSERETVIDASIPAGGRIRAPVRSRVTQRAELVRLPWAADCRRGAAPDRRAAP